MLLMQPCSRNVIRAFAGARRKIAEKILAKASGSDDVRSLEHRIECRVSQRVDDQVHARRGPRIFHFVRETHIHVPQLSRTHDDALIVDKKANVVIRPYRYVEADE